MGNIFEGAKFGDKFVCKNGEVAIFIRKFECNGSWYFMSNGRTEFSVRGDGAIEQLLFSVYGGDYDIVGRYEPEGLDEDGLDEISTKECIMMLDKYNKDIDLSDVIELMILAYRHAYRKAKEG